MLILWGRSKTKLHVYTCNRWPVIQINQNKNTKEMKPEPKACIHENWIKELDETRRINRMPKCTTGNFKNKSEQIRKDTICEDKLARYKRLFCLEASCNIVMFWASLSSAYNEGSAGFAPPPHAPRSEFLALLQWQNDITQWYCKCHKHDGATSL